MTDPITEQLQRARGHWLKKFRSAHLPNHSTACICICCEQRRLDLLESYAAEAVQQARLEIENKCLSQARICNLENERLTMNGNEERARYWEGRSDAFQDCVAFARAAERKEEQ